MAKPKCIVTADITEPYLARIKELCDVTVCGWVETGTFMTDEEMIDILHDAEILIVGYEQIGANIINASQKLKLIACIRGNPVNVDAEACTKRGIPLVFTPGRNANSVAEYIIGAMISLIRSIARSDREIRNGRFLGEPSENIYEPSARMDMVWSMGMPDNSPFAEYQGFEVFGKTFGMIGYGAVGRKLSKMLSGMGVKLLAYDPYVASDVIEADGIEKVGMEELLQRSDFVSLHCKVTEETKGMFGEKEFALMKPTAYFINTARGIIVNQKALVDALKQGEIAGAVLDVFWEEPMPSNHPLLTMDNVIITPHIAGASRDVSVQHSIIVAEDVERFVNGKRPVHVFNGEVYRD